MNNPVVIYHANCVDGFTAAWVTYRHLLKKGFDEPRLISAQYGDEPPSDVNGNDVFIVDFSYPRDVLLAIRRVAASLVVLDHHKTAEKSLAGLDFCIFDFNESGASLTWKFFNAQGLLPNLVNVPTLIKFVRDRDLWKHELVRTKEVNEFIRSFDFSIEAWDRLANMLDTEFDQVCAHGRSLLRMGSKIINSHLHHSHLVHILGMEVRAVNCTVGSLFGSEIAGELAKNSPSKIGATWFYASGGKFVWSLRSTQDGPDVSSMCEVFGGGGHAHAAGFSVGLEKHTRIVKP